MVYCGKPSRGCQMCRTRRIKCDETKPTCLQCQKSRRQCPGYKDDFDLVFRNETQATERRARRGLIGRKSNIQDVSKRLNDYGGTDDSSRAMTSSSAISYQSRLTIPVEQQAMNYFLANWVLVPKPGQVAVTRGFLDYIVPLIKHEPANSHLTAAFEAVSLASLGNRPESKELLGTAWQKYTKALSIVNRALAHPVVQRSDQTLAAVMLLGLFETITLRRTNIAAWGTHIEGAVMLVKLRGKKQLRTKIGSALFSAVRQIMIVSCMGASKSPELGVEWWISRDPKKTPAQKMTELILRVSELRADVNRAMMLMPRTPENATKIQDLVNRAEVIETGFQEWLKNVPEEMEYRTVAWMDAIPGEDPGQSEIFPGKVDMYKDLTMAAHWNSYRVARLFLSGIFIRCAAWTCAPVDYRTTPEYASASRLGVDMINDMVASIPYHLGWIGESGQFRTDGNTGFACGEDGNGKAKVLGAYLLVWPLFTTICSDFTTDAQRKYVIGRLNYMTNNLGLSQAAVLSNFQLRLPSMIVKRDSMGIAALDRQVSGSERNKLPTSCFSATSKSSSIPAFPSFAPTAVSPPIMHASHIYDRSAVVHAGAVPNLRPDLEVLNQHTPFYATTTIAPLSTYQVINPAHALTHQNAQTYYTTINDSNAVLVSLTDFSGSLPMHVSSHELQSSTPYQLPSTCPQSYPTPTSALSPTDPSLPPQFPIVFSTQGPQGPQGLSSPDSISEFTSFQLFQQKLSRSPEMVISSIPENSVPAYDHSSPPSRTQAEEVDEADETLKSEAERHRAEKVAFRRSFGAVIAMVNGKDMADGMYRNSSKAVGVGRE